MKQIFMLYRVEKQPNLFGVQETTIYPDCFSNIKGIYEYSYHNFPHNDEFRFPPYKFVLDSLKHNNKITVEISSELHYYVIRRMTVNSSFYEASVDRATEIDLKRVAQRA